MNEALQIIARLSSVRRKDKARASVAAIALFTMALSGISAAPCARTEPYPEVSQCAGSCDKWSESCKGEWVPVPGSPNVVTLSCYCG